MALVEGDPQLVEFDLLVTELEEIERRRARIGHFDARDAEQHGRLERQVGDLVRLTLPVDDRRAHARVPCDLPVFVRIGSRRWPGLVIDVGSGGLFVETAAPGGAGELVHLEMGGPTEEEGLHLVVEVTWACSDPQRPPGLGVAFLSPDEPATQRLRALSRRLLREKLVASRGA